MTANNHHRQAFENILFGIRNEPDLRILDVGAGKTSVSMLTRMFPNVTVQAVVHPGDKEQIDCIKNGVRSRNYRILEKEISCGQVTGDYNLLVCHLAFGRALQFGIKIEDMLEGILTLQSEHIVFIDYDEDPKLDFGCIQHMCEAEGYKLESDYVQQRESPKKFNDFTGTRYLCQLYQKTKKEM